MYQPQARHPPALHPSAAPYAGSPSPASLPPTSDGGEQAPAATTALDLERKRTFALLQPICSLLLLQRGEPQRLTELLAGVQRAMYGRWVG